MLFPSKVDAWLPAVAIGIPVTVLAGVLFISFRVKGSAVPALLTTAIVLVVATFVAWTFATTDYRVDDATLIVRSGPFRWRIAIAEIDSVMPTSDPTSSPALSLDRLQIRYRKRGQEAEILVSPDDKHGFIAALRRVNGAIRVP